MDISVALRCYPDASFYPLNPGNSTTTVEGQEFVDRGKEDSVKDMKSRVGKFVVVDSEKEADYLIIVIQRNRVGNKNELKATLSFKGDGQWKPGASLTGVADSWGLAARRVMGQASDWVEHREKNNNADHSKADWRDCRIRAVAEMRPALGPFP